MISPLNHSLKTRSSRKLDFVPQIGLDSGKGGKTASNGLEDDLQDRRLNRSEKSARHLIKMGLYWVLAICAVVMIASYLANMLLPAELRWLSQEDLSNLKDVVISIASGLIMSLAISHVSK